MAEYLIQDTTLSGLGDGVRHITGDTTTLTPAQMEAKLKVVTVYDYTESMPTSEKDGSVVSLYGAYSATKTDSTVALG